MDTTPTGTPRQVFPVRAFTFEVYDPPSKGQAPIVLLKDRDGEVKWAVHATGWDNTDVYSLKFRDSRTLLNTTVRGLVHWTHGYEVTWWIIGRDGSLKGYWYSW